MADQFTLFIGGGGDDWISHIVERYEARHSRLNPKMRCQYFSWTQPGQVTSILHTLPANAHVTVVGHSYGADAAFSAVTSGRAVHVLISIDPVGRIRPSWTSIRAAARTWLNVRAEPRRPHAATSTTPSPRSAANTRVPPRRGKPARPISRSPRTRPHGWFDDMMRAEAGGSSGASLLGGTRVS